ncbi:helix-turn-helix domain-containing protein [Peptoniphilus sp. MSJ-1]|uniref:Helix-turn-helix domain-containing protein n=1 Tax=Peptoniphilus ovalis TaxID=2841503 RepID=A0ABS6FFX0_9FIRM|nr:helix-turn-helix domain-containing protein [Peptoniphilus ovalis]MBU5668861.1 helix-turn-helix domain-containing protein [Peptoniphilus ovalis]
MNQYVTGLMIKELREKNKMTQKELAEKLSVSDKTISKWERGNGYPDITLLEPIADAFSVSVSELISGVVVNNSNRAANIMKSKFYICPVCGNIIHSVGNTVVHCHGIKLEPEIAEETDEMHKIFIEKIENEYYVRIEHEMTKKHYISFIAAISSGKIEMEKLYPQGDAYARFKMDGVKRIIFYCNRDGLFFIDVVKGIDDKEGLYADSKERKELELAAKKLFG